MHVLHPHRSLVRVAQPVAPAQVACVSPATPAGLPGAQAPTQAQLAQYQAELSRQNAHIQTQARAVAQHQATMAVHAQAQAENAAMFRSNAVKEVDWRLLDDESGVRQNVSKDAMLDVGSGAQPLINVLSESGNACTVAISIDVDYNPNGAALPDAPDADVLIILQWGTSRGLHTAEVSPGTGTTFTLSGSSFQLSARNTGNVPMRVAAGIGVGPVAIIDEPKRVFRFGTLEIDGGIARVAVPKYGYKFGATRLPVADDLVLRQYTSLGLEVQLSSDVLAAPGGSVSEIILSPLCRAVTILSSGGAFTRLDPFFFLSL